MGMMMGGGGFGGYQGPSRAGGGPGTAPGLPFAGIPPEMLDQVQKLFRDEQDPEVGEVQFTQVYRPERRLTVLRFIGPHWPKLLIALVLVTLDTVTMQIGPLLTQRAVDLGITQGNFGYVLGMSLIFLAATLLNAVFNYLRLRFTGRLGQKLMYELRVRVFTHIQRLSPSYFTGEMSGRVMTRMTSDIEQLQMLFSEGIITMAVQLATLLFVMGVLFTMNVRLTLIVVLLLVPALAVLTLWFSWASDRAYLRVREKVADVLADLAENLGGIRVVASYNRQKHNTIKHRNVVGEHLDANVTATKISSFYGAASQFVGVASQAAILAVGGAMVLGGDLTIGQLVAFVMYLQAFFAPIQQLVQLYNTYQQGRAAMIKIADLLTIAPEVPEKEDAHDLPPITGEIALDSVAFGYKREEPVLHDVTLQINAGETFALVGSTGAGKSTIVKLITRFYDPLAGRVLVDGHDLRDVTFYSLRSQLGIVPQEPFLFAGTIRDNIKFAKPDATEEEVLEACRAVGISDLIERLPMGLDTPCHERGVTLSSGERQLLALARAFLAQPRVLILDEAMSNLDLGTEAKVERALDVLLQGRTAVLIAHRLNTAMRASRIAVIEDGRVLELGSHAELVAKGGRYADMYATWISHMQTGAAEAPAFIDEQVSGSALPGGLGGGAD